MGFIGYFLMKAGAMAIFAGSCYAVMGMERRSERDDCGSHSKNEDAQGSGSVVDSDSEQM